MSGKQPEHPWSQSVDTILDSLEVSVNSGLSGDEVSSRREQFGRNVLAKAKRRHPLAILIDQFKSLVILLLAAAALVSFFIGQTVEAIAVAAAILINTVIGFFTELKAVKSMDALRSLGTVRCRVRRDGSEKSIPADELVLGDVVLIDEGDVIPADLRLVEANKLQLNESALTGESVPVSKHTDATDESTPLAERLGMVYKGTAVTSGTGIGIAVAVGTDTEIGNVQAMVSEAEDEATPLEKRLDHLARSLIWVTLGLTAIVAVVGILRGQDTALMIKSAVALAVAAIPEGLPIVATVALARGMILMARRNALIRRLSSVETLGATSVIGTDKTGTLTENEMTVTRYRLHNADIDVDDDNPDDPFRSNDDSVPIDDSSLLREALKMGVLCANASLGKSDGSDDNGASGDPMEVALLRAGKLIDLGRPELLDDLPEKREESFDRETRKMATFHESDDGYYVAIKGAPEAVIDNCTSVLTDDGTSDLSDDDKEQWHDYNKQLASDGLRVLALARNQVDSSDAEPYDGMTLVGLVGLLDPARDDVADAINECHNAGIRVIMITGDQPGTAAKIARDVNLVDEDDPDVMLGSELGKVKEMSAKERDELLDIAIFSRVDPRQKLNIIDAHQKAGSVVAMTGDGVNDAPALKEADIGIAMGRRGTEVAKEAADMILQDDAFPTIVHAVRQGRIIFNNIRKFIVYLLSGNVSEIIAVGFASLVALPLPLLPLQILFLNVVLDVFPALSLGVGRGDPRVMEQRPRPADEAVLTRQHWYAVAIYGVIIAAVIIGALLGAMHWLGMPAESAVTVSFLALTLSRLWHVFNMRQPLSPIIRNEITRNPFIWIAHAVSLAIIVLAIYLPVLNDVLGLSHPGLDGWLLAFVASTIPLIAGQILKITRIIRV